MDIHFLLCHLNSVAVDEKVSSPCHFHGAMNFYLIWKLSNEQGQIKNVRSLLKRQSDLPFRRIDFTQSDQSNERRRSVVAEKSVLEAARTL